MTTGVERGSVMRADALKADMIVQVIAGAAPMRVDRVAKSTHNGKPCLVIYGSEGVGGGKVEPVKWFVGYDHTVTLWEPRAA